jgi:hypothetical protein
VVVDEENIVNPIDRNADDDEKIRQLQRLTAENQPIVKKLLRDVDSEHGTNSGTSEKLPDRIKEKAHRPSILQEKPYHKIEHIRDAFRFKTVLDNIDALPKIAEKLRDSGVDVVKVDTDKVLNPGVWGWRIAVFDLKMPNGQLVEYYCPVKEMEEAKRSGNHQLFEKWRNVDVRTLTPVQKAERLKDIDTSFEKYDAAWSAYLGRTRQLPEHVRKVLDRTREILERPRQQERQPEGQTEIPQIKLDRLFGKQEPSAREQSEKRQQEDPQRKRDREREEPER